MSVKCFFIEPVGDDRAPDVPLGALPKGRLYRRTDTGDMAELSVWARVPGAMWDAHWLTRGGHDGRKLVVVAPNGHHWMIDGRASNCTMPGDNEHRCWTRTGEPPNITVGKQYGPTCGAGAGSIGIGDYHGFLRGGEFT